MVNSIFDLLFLCLNIRRTSPEKADPIWLFLQTSRLNRDREFWSEQGKAKGEREKVQYFQVSTHPTLPQSTFYHPAHGTKGTVGTVGTSIRQYTFTTWDTWVHHFFSLTSLSPPNPTITFTNPHTLTNPVNANANAIQFTLSPLQLISNSSTKNTDHQIH